MNRLILLGNGFDLAHNIKTSYNDFILWYVKKCFKQAWEGPDYEDVLISISSKEPFPDYNFRGIKNSSDFVDHFYNINFISLFDSDTFKIKGWANNYTNPFNITIKSLLFRQLIANCSKSNWVEIENQFYKLLKLIGKQGGRGPVGLDNLNESLSFIKEQLALYLSGLNVSAKIEEYDNLFRAPFYYQEQIYGFRTDKAIDKTMILNFNYTSTAEKYVINKNIDLDYIHGKIKDNANPMIFGFGDEIDESYHQLELENNNALFKHIKSFWYSKTNNYHDLIRFIQLDKFQVYIMGHSCGLSDRTMLNMIFEHENCLSVKIFYYIDDKGNNNYENLTHEISRHFKDKVAMRKKIVSLPNSLPMPQLL